MPETKTVFSGATPELGHQLLDGEQDPVVAAAGAPADLLVAGPVLLRGDGDLCGAHDVAPSSSAPRLATAASMASSISRDLNGRPWTFDDRRDVDEVRAAEMVGELAPVELGQDHPLGSA